MFKTLDVCWIAWLMIKLVMDALAIIYFIWRIGRVK